MTKKVMIYKGQDFSLGWKIIEEHAGTIMADYGSSVLVRLEEAGIQALQDEQFRCRELTERSTIEVSNFRLDLTAPSLHSSTPFALTSPLPTSGRHHLLTIAGPMHDSWKAQLESHGVTIFEKMAPHTYLIEVDSQHVDAVLSLPFTETVTPYLPAFKINESLLTPQIQDDLTIDIDGLEAMPILSSDDGDDVFDEPMSFSLQASDIGTPFSIVEEQRTANIEVVLFDKEDAAAVTAAMQDQGALIISNDEERIISFLPLEKLHVLAGMPEIRAINPYGPERLHNNVASDIIQVNQVKQSFGLDGRGQVVAVADSGLDTGENNGTILPDFAGRIIQIYAFGRPNDASDIHNHGTHVAGSVLGNGASSNGQIQGMAPQARLVFQSVMDANRELGGLPGDLSQNLFKVARDDGAHIHSNSWGADTNGAYTARSSDVDRFAFANRDFLIVFSAGNEAPRRVGAPGTAKNALTVGASESIRPLPGLVRFPASPKFPSGTQANFDSQANDRNNVASFSSVGPAEKNRQKPDVVAPGTWILSTRSSVSVGDTGPDGIPNTSDEDNIFTHLEAVGQGLPGQPVFGSGDKNTPPLPAGVGSAAAQHYYYSNGTSMATPITSGSSALLRQYLVEQRNHTPSAALLKALLINGAIDMGMGIPDRGQGWGRVDLQNTINPDGQHHVHFDDAVRKAVASGDVRSYLFNAVDSSEPVAVTLVWRDPPGKTIQNELFLRVTHLSSGATFSSENINNILNNVQKVVIPEPATDLYLIEVEGVDVDTGIPELAPALRQDYALVITGATNLRPRITIGDVILRRNRLWGYTILGVQVIDDQGEPLSPKEGATVEMTIRQDANVKQSGVLPYYRRGRYHIWRFNQEGLSDGEGEVLINVSYNGQRVESARGSITL